MELHSLLHCGIETMGRNELATFVVTAEGVVDGAQENATDSSSKPPADRRFEYVISLDDWMEEVDLSERQDNSLMKRVLREGDGVTRPVEIGGVTVRYVCLSTRLKIGRPGNWALILYLVRRLPWLLTERVLSSTNLKNSHHSPYLRGRKDDRESE